MTVILTLALLLVPLAAHAVLPANEIWRENLLNFREGWAKFGNVTGPGSGVTGGAGGTLCTVSNLNDSGAGSLRSCIMTSGPQWIIFSVSGTIQLLSDLFPTLGHQGPGANKTIDGRGQVITISANAGGNGLMQACADNWIIHNIKMTTVPNGAFIFRNLASNGTWFDHVDLTGAGQTLVSAFFGTAGIGPPCTPNVDVATNVTVSWTKTHDICTPGSGQVWPNCGSGMYLVGGSGNDTGMTNFTGTFHHNWYTHTSGVRFPIVYYGRMHSYNNWMDNTDQGAQAIYHARHVWENNIFECHPDNGDHMQCGFSGNPHRVWCNFTNAQVTQPSDCCRVTGSWLVTGTETFTEQNAASCFSPAADYSYTLDIADAALKTKLQDPNTGAGVVPNPYNSVSATGPPAVTITGPTSSPTYSTSTTPLTPILSGTATDDVGVVSVTWACPTCTPTSGTATCATCGATATSVSWSVASIGLAAGSNVITVTATDNTATTGTDTLTVTRTAPDITTGLIAHYKFNDNASPATDSTGLGHTGTLVGTPSYVAGTTNMGRAMAFDTSGTQYISTADANDLDFIGAYTLAAWVKPNATLTGMQTLIAKNNSPGVYSYYLYANMTTGSNCGGVSQILGGHKPGTTGDACTTTTLTPGVWTHVALTYDGTTTQIYLNGVASGSPATPTGPPVAGTGPLDIGHSQYGEFLLNTVVDDVRIYNRALTATDLAVLGVLPDIATGLRAHYKFNDAAGTATDSTGLGHTGTFVAGATYGAGPPNLGNALALNGTSQYVSVADAADLDFTTAYTLTGWFFPTSTGTTDAGIVKPGPGTPQYAYYLYPRLSGICGTDAIVAGFDSSNQVCYATALTSNQWTHVGVTFANGSATTLYVGGVPVATGGATASTVATAQALLLGNSQFSEFFAGRMDEIRLYNRELTAVDMNAVASVVDASNPPTVTITTDCGAGAGNNCTVSSATLTTFAGTATDDVGVPVGGITWTCPTCTPTSGTATCATCGPSATSVSWSVASITLASGTNVLTVTALDADGQASTSPDAITITYTVVSSTVPTVLRLVR